MVLRTCHTCVPAAHLHAQQTPDSDCTPMRGLQVDDAKCTNGCCLHASDDRLSHAADMLTAVSLLNSLAYLSADARHNSLLWPMTCS